MLAMLSKLALYCLPGMGAVAGVGAGACGRIPADGGGQVFDAVVVCRSIERRGAVAGTVAGGAGDILALMCRMMPRCRWDGVAAPAGRRRSRGRRTRLRI